MDVKSKANTAFWPRPSVNQFAPSVISVTLSPGESVREAALLTVSAPCGVTTQLPVPSLRRETNQSFRTLAADGRVKVPRPPVQT